MKAEFDKLVYVETPGGGVYMPADQSHVTLSMRHFSRWAKAQPWPARRRSGCRFRKSKRKTA